MSRKKILITGIVSLLGKYLAQILHQQFTTIGTTHKIQTGQPLFKILSVDITNQNTVKRVINLVEPDVVIHLAALSNIDYCERHPKEAYRVNVMGTQNIVRALAGSKTHLVFVSSSMIFDGQQSTYSETDTSNPLNTYGKTKVAAENIIRNSSLAFTIVRCCTFFGWPPSHVRDNDVTYYLKHLAKTAPLYLVNDRYFNPVYTHRVAVAVKKIIDKGHCGIFHIAGKDKITRFTFVQTLIKAFQITKHPQVIPVSSRFFPYLASRPVNTTLSTTKMQNILGLKPHALLDELRLVSREWRLATNVP